MTITVPLDFSGALRFTVPLELVLGGESTVLAARKQKFTPPPPKPAVHHIEKIEPKEVTRHTTSKGHWPQLSRQTVYLCDKELGVPIQVDVNPDKSETFMFDVPSEDLPLEDIPESHLSNPMPQHYIED